MQSRKAAKITHRVSSVTGNFVQAVLPDVVPDPDEEQRVLDILGIDAKRLTCAYCGEPAHHWDHLNPYVRSKRPSGYLNNAYNRVPACAPCNTSKSGHDWRKWILGGAKGSPTTRKIADVSGRIEKLSNLERATNLMPVDLGSMVPADLWHAYWAKRDEIEKLMFEAQLQAEQIRSHISAAIAR